MSKLYTAGSAPMPRHLASLNGSVTMIPPIKFGSWSARHTCTRRDKSVRTSNWCFLFGKIYSTTVGDKNVTGMCLWVYKFAINKWYTVRPHHDSDATICPDDRYAHSAVAVEGNTRFYINRDETKTVIIVYWSKLNLPRTSEPMANDNARLM